MSWRTADYIIGGRICASQLKQSRRCARKQLTGARVAIRLALLCQRAKDANFIAIRIAEVGAICRSVAAWAGRALI
jgi:hypothetical protein